MTLRAQCQSSKITFNMDWSFGGGQMEKVLLEGLIEQTRKVQSQGVRMNFGANSGLRKVNYVPLALSVTSAYHSAGGPVKNIVTWRQIKAKVFTLWYHFNDCLFLRNQPGWSWDEDTEADTRRINVEPQLWDSFFADFYPAKKKIAAKRRYGWFSRNTVPHWSLLEEAFGYRLVTHNLMDFSHQRQNSPDWDEEGGTPVDGDSPASVLPTFFTSISPSISRGSGADDDHDDDDDDDDDDLEALTSLPTRKRSAAGKTSASKRAKREPSALGIIAEQLLAANLQREREFEERRPSWKRAWEVIQDSYKTEWAKLSTGALGCLHLVLSQCPANLSAQGSDVTYADLILAIGNDKRRDNYVHKVLKLATKFQEEEIESSGGEL